MKPIKKYDLRFKTYKSPYGTYLLSLISYLFLLIPLTGSCQLLDSVSLDTMIGCHSMHEAMENPESVIKLDLSKQKLQDFPEDIRKLTNLQYLDLSKNKISSVPAWIGELKNLQFLILSKTKIDSFPPQFGDLINLKELIMNRSELTRLPHTIGNLKELRYMDLWGSNLSYFPFELSYLSDNLRVFRLEDVLIGSKLQAALKAELPNTTIEFTPSCACEQ
jgi:Leucine-rich repeat (LRR) protein